MGHMMWGVAVAVIFCTTTILQWDVVQLILFRHSDGD